MYSSIAYKVPAVSDLSLQLLWWMQLQFSVQCEGNKSAAQQADDLVESHPPAVSCSAAGL